MRGVKAMLGYFEFFSPVKIVAGEKALEHIPFELGLPDGCLLPESSLLHSGF